MKIVKFMHYKNPISNELEYCTVNENNHYKFYSKEKIPKKYTDLLNKSCDKDTGEIELMGYRIVVLLKGR